MIKKTNSHVHTTGSDGKNTPKEVIEEAIKMQLDHLCFTDHFKRPNKDPWAKNFFSEDYLKEIELVKEKYKDKIDISFGAEVDWFEGFEKEIKSEMLMYKFDFVLGSVHFLKNSKGNNYLVNGDKEMVGEEVKIAGGENFVKEYFRLVRDLSNSKIPDVIAHLDVIKLNNKNNFLFDEEGDIYKEELLNTLDVIKKNGQGIEINTSGLIYDCNSIFPSPWILKEAKKREIPLTLGTDAHSADRVDHGLFEAKKMARDAGYKKILIFKNRKPIEVKL